MSTTQELLVELARLFVELMGLLAWPVAIVIVVILLKSHIAELLGRITSLRHKGTELTFGEATDKVSEEAREVLSTVTTAKEGEKTLKARGSLQEDKFLALIPLVNTHPDMAVVQAWKYVDEQIREFPGVLQAGEKYLPTARVIGRLANQGLVPDSVIPALKELNALRNRAVHESKANISSSAAAQYVEAASDVYETLWMLS
ncbi:hypothetical protein [Pyruvatibacter sp.]|uniref:hypothetical protein n=1 Tax=Pyruvatibacter sp. TaxID=1981328 RepID=UPI0032EF44FA